LWWLIGWPSQSTGQPNLFVAFDAVLYAVWRGGYSIPLTCHTEDQTLPLVELIIPAADGRIGWKDVSHALGKALKLNQASIANMLPDGEINLRSHAVSFSLLAINLAIGDRLAFAVTRDSDQQLGLSIRCDESLIQVADPSAQPVRARIHHDADWLDGGRRPVVLFLHGLTGKPEVFDSMREAIRSRGYRTASIGYDLQQPLSETARHVSEVVAAKLAASSSDPELVLVGHSMGGLIAREWTDNPLLHNASIRALITIGTPHQGSAWATLPPLLNLFANGEFGPGDVSDVILHTPSSPELRDIAPGSEFLTSLNSRLPRRDVRYTSIIGTGSPIDASTVHSIQHTFQQLERRDGFVRLIRPRIEPLMEGFDELARGRGDGIVAANRAVMEASEDIVRVELSHFDLVRPIDPELAAEGNTHPVWDLVMDRLDGCCATENDRIS